MNCPDLLRTQAYFDGEVDALAAAEIGRHAEHCAECGALLADLDRGRAAMRREFTALRTPPALRARILHALDEEASPPSGARQPRRMQPSRRSFWAGALAGAGGSLAAAALAFFLLLPGGEDALLDEAAAAHVRSLMPGHLIDVVSTDQHTVKPWFSGHADVSPVVADFSADGYALVGGRADYLDHQRAAVVVYQHGPHVINVFSWAAGVDGSARRGRFAGPGAEGHGNLPATATRSGYRMLSWRVTDVQYCAVSDTGWDELAALARRIKDSSTGNRSPVADPPTAAK